MLLLALTASGQTRRDTARFRVMSYNVENLFDYRHDTLKEDREFLPDAIRHWNYTKYRKKLNDIARVITAVGQWETPALVALCEVENDSVLRDLTRYSALREAGYRYLMTHSPDLRGIDVALLYHDFSFSPVSHASLRVSPVEGMSPTRDILYVSGRVITDDTLHVFVVHSPSRRDGERFTRPHRLAVASRLCAAIDSVREVSAGAKIIVAGDFNDYSGAAQLDSISAHGMTDVTEAARGANGAKATYRFKGKWGSLDHIFLSRSLLYSFEWSRVNDLPFLVEEDEKYGGVKPRRTYNGYRYQRNGVSDHLPLVVRLRLR